VVASVGAIRRSSYAPAIPRLRESDYQKVLGVLHEAAAVDGPNPFPEPVLKALRSLVSCDVVAYHELFEGHAERTIVWSGEPRGELTDEEHAAGKRYSHQDPMTPTHGARKYSDFFSLREFHRLELYQHNARPFGVEYMMRLWLSATGERQARLEFDREGPDFVERDRAVLDLLLPHLRQFSRAASKRRELQRRRPSMRGRTPDFAGAAGHRLRCGWQDECRDRLAARDLAGDRSETPRKRVRKAGRSLANGRGGGAVRSGLRADLVCLSKGA
jgi:hypothetical protein